MATSEVHATGWIAVAAGAAGLLALVFIVLFFLARGPFGTINDLAIGLAALLTAALVWRLYVAQDPPAIGYAALIAAAVGTLLIVLGCAFVVSGARGWFLSGLYMASGNALIGLWLLWLNLQARHAGTLPDGLTALGIASAIIMVLGLLTLPGILTGIDAWEAAPLYVNLGWIGALGWLLLYPLWCVLAGRIWLSQ
jgi:hypothetical protein